VGRVLQIHLSHARKLSASPASEADRELVERLTVAMGAPSLSAAIREAIRNEFARLSK
jgi:hypothetical protein